MIVLLIDLHLFIPLRWLWPFFKVTAVSNSFNCQCYVLNWLSWNLEELLNTLSRSWSRVFKGDNWHVSWFDKNFNVDFFVYTVQTTFFKLCKIITLLRVYEFVLDLITLTLLQGHRYVRIITCKSVFVFVFFNSCPLSCKHCLVSTYIKKIKHSVLFVSSVYLRDINNTFFSIVHLNVSHLSVCCSFVFLSFFLFFSSFFHSSWYAAMNQCKVQDMMCIRYMSIATFNIDHPIAICTYLDVIAY